jgi:hypothetical protein
MTPQVTAPELKHGKGSIMHNVKCVILLFAASLSLTGCMADTVYELRPIANQVPRSTRAPEEIELYKADVVLPKPVVVFANIGAHGNGFATMETLETAMRERAAAIGADLVILTRYEITRDETIGTYGGGFFTAEQIKRPHLYAVAAVYSKVRIGLFVEDNGNIKYVVADSPAEKVGLKEGMQILSLNGIYYHNRSVMDQEVGVKNPGDVVTIEYLDSSKEKKKVTVKLQSS